MEVTLDSRCLAVAFLLGTSVSFAVETVPNIVFTLRRGSYKLIQFAEDDRAELYDLNDDLDESNDLGSSRPQVASAMRRELSENLQKMNARHALPPSP